MDLQTRIREAAQAGPKTKRKIWLPPTFDDFAAGSVLSFDQTITKTGFSLVVKDHVGLHIVEGNVLLAPAREGVKGFESDLQRATMMANQIEVVVMLRGDGLTAIVHEMPVVQGYWTHSSKMGALAVRLAAQRHARGVPVAMVSKQATARLLVPPDRDRASKADMKAGVERLIPDWMRATKRWTQDVSDSAANALLYLFHLNQEASDVDDSSDRG